MAATSPESQALHDMAAREGREPTREETAQAIRSRMSRSPKNTPAEIEKQARLVEEGGATSEWGETVVASTAEPATQDMLIGSIDDPTRPIETLDDLPPEVSQIYAHQRAQLDSIIRGNTDDFAEREEMYRQGVDTVEDELINYLEKQYNEEFIDQGVLNNIDDLPDEEKISRIYGEFMRLDSQKEHVRNLLALNLLRQGLGDLPVKTLDGMWTNLQPSQVNALYEQYRRQQLDELNSYVDRIAAEQGEGFTTAAATGEIILQDVIPLWGASTRILGTNKFLPDDVDMNILRRGFPGEVRQELREWWVNASHEERINWLQDLERTWSKIRKGPQSGLYTRYLVIENLLGTFTDELLYQDNPNDSFDRVMGNLDTALGMVVATGLIAKRGKSVFDLWSGPKHNVARQVAAAGGSRQAQEALDESIRLAAEKHGFTVEEASVPHLTKPKQLELDLGLEVETDTVKHTTTPNDLRRQRILEYTDDVDVTLLSKQDKANAVSREIEELSNNDTVHVMHKMSTMRGLPNDTGVEFTVTFGSRGGEGWGDLADLLDDMRELDPYQEFRIMRRGANGKLEPVDVSWAEIVDYYATGRVPKALEEFIEMTPEAKEISRFFGGRRLNKVSMEELQGALESGWIPLDNPMYDFVREEIRLRNAKGVDGLTADPMLLLDGEELFVQIDKTHYFDSGDIGETIGAFRWFDNPFSGGAFNVYSRLFPPNTKFDRLYEAFSKSYHIEEAVGTEFADMLVPFDKLSTKRKQQVGEIIEWVEDYAKDMYHQTGMSRAPTKEEIVAHFDNVDQQTLDGYQAVRDAMDGMYDVLNRRLYRDFNNRGFVTIRGTDDSLPIYHGAPIRSPEPGAYYDPVRRELVQVDEEEIASILADGGGAIKLDFPIDAVSGGKFDRILVRKGEYEFGRLSNRVLNYYEGYHFRFYEDPYFIVKRTYGPTVNGKKLADDEFIDEAVRTAGSYAEANRFINRGRARRYDNGKGEWVRADGKGPVLIIKPAKQINNTEGSLYQKQALHREGRMFWDERSHERLPDTTGNRAKIADPSMAMQKGLAVATRQSTQEGLMKTLKQGFKNEFGDLPMFTKNKHKLEMDQLDELEKDLVKGRNESSGETRARYRRALEIIRYMRNQMGTDSWAVPYLRQTMLHWAQWLDNVLGGKASWALGPAQRLAMSLDPFARMRKIAYGAFMVLRPARQLLLQSMQVSMLTGLAPGYIGTGKIFFDAYALRRGLTRFRRAGFDDGWSDAKVAKAMGLSKREYKRLVEEFQRSGLMGSVNTHSFNAKGRNLSARLDPKAGPVGRFVYNARAVGRGAYNKLARGFEIGEQNNLTMTYLVALRRMKKKYNVEDITKFTREQWDEITSEADSLALAMTRPNKFGYQTGATGTITQFLSFQHRALLTFIGMNPKIKGADTLKIVGANYLLWGGNMFGAEDFARELLAGWGMSNHATDEIAPGVTLQDLLAAGLIETGVNGLARVITEDEWKDMNLSVLAPGGAVAEIYKQFIELATKSPLEAGWLGPFTNQASGIVKGIRFLQGDAMNNPTRTPGEKFLRSADYLLRQVLPQYNDANRGWISYQLGVWVDKDGDKLGYQPTIATLAARGLFGLRTEEEMAHYRMKTLHWKNQENIRDWVDTWKPVMKEIALKWRDGEYSDDKAYELVAVIHSLTEDAPEGIRQTIYRQLLEEPDGEGVSIADIVAEAAQQGTMNIRKMEPYINQQTDLTPDQKKILIDFINQVGAGYVDADEEYRTIIDTDLKSKGIE